MYFGLLTLCAAMFSVQFLFTDMFKNSYGSGLKSTLVFTMGSSVVGVILLTIINGFNFGFTPFAIVMATVNAINGALFTLCSLQALKKCNLSLYSVFSMLGGMALPFVTGIVFYNEPLTAGKIICFVFITMALFIPIRKGEKSGGTIYYAGLFILNGMAGVIAKFYSDAPFEKVGAVEFSVLSCIAAFVLAFVLFLIFCREKTQRKFDLKCLMSIAGGGFLSRIANMFLLVSLAKISASAQYPFITGGTMVFSTLICFFIGQKPSKKELLAVGLSFAGIVLMVLI